MNTTQASVDKPIEEMTHEELVAEVQRLRSETDSSMPHPAVWANAEKLHNKAVNQQGYYSLPDSAKRAVEALGLLVEIRNWDPAAS
jgi:hypothetical protein